MFVSFFFSLLFTYLLTSLLTYLINDFFNCSSTTHLLILSFMYFHNLFNYLIVYFLSQSLIFLIQFILISFSPMFVLMKYQTIE